MWRPEDLFTHAVIHAVFVTSQYLAIAMEYAAGGDMFEHVVRKGGLKESEARWFFQQLLVGVDYVHRMVSAPCKAGLITDTTHGVSDMAHMTHLAGHGMWHLSVTLCSIVCEPPSCSHSSMSAMLK